ncbi:hypothetical protein Lnau_1544 [Legionella nautarum]|uniref:Uncharacterized protein n=1 Tax=Legionella nautarum TaxID=45070 RepID=A0A0W0WW62_9GAMM|nr:hypothetical protein [Legionella nautarum]KTD36560.1 hypothetical protein Lnau_1544 [Legionella nautarum]
MQAKCEYKRVSIEEAKANPAYWEVTQNMFSQQTSSVIKEPLGDKYQEHAKRIKRGDWLKLNFRDPEFKRNIFKAFRLGKINKDQMATTFLLFDALNDFGAVGPHRLRQFSFDDPKGPYQIDSISYLIEDNEANFEQELDKVPASERGYFSIDMSRQFAVAFLFDGLHKINPNFFDRYPQFIGLLKAYVNSLPISLKGQATLLSQIQNLQNPFLRNDAGYALTGFILDYEKPLAPYLKKRYFKSKKGQVAAERNSSMFLVDLMITGEQIPFIVSSPNFNVNKRNSPLLSMILPTMPAFTALMNAMHGQDVTLPYYTVGTVSPSFIRYADEEPELYGSETALRPVELDHPDVSGNETPHETLTTSFPKEWHDLFHAWRNANPLKPLMRHLRQVLTKGKGFDMSKSIWAISDMDFSAGRLHREAQLENPRAEITRDHYYAIFLRLSSEFWSNLEQHDDNLLLIADMIIHREQWKELMGDYPENILAYVPQEDNPNNAQFKDVFHRMKGIIDADEKRDSRESAMYYVLSYRLRNNRHGIELCNILDKLGLETLFYWNRNSGLYIDKNLSALPIRAIEQLDSDVLYEELIGIVHGLGLDESLAADLAKLHAREKLSSWELFRQDHPIIDDLIYYGASFVQATAITYLSTLLFSTGEEDQQQSYFKMQ